MEFIFMFKCYGHMEQVWSQGPVAEKGRTYDHPTEQWDSSLSAPSRFSKASSRENDNYLS